MAHYGDNQIKLTGLTATSSLAAKQYHLVKFASTAGQVKVASSATSNLVGVLQNDPAAGEAAEVAIFGESKVVAAASISVGDKLVSNSTGQAKTSSTIGAVVIGYAKTASSTAGNIITVILSGKYTVATA